MKAGSDEGLGLFLGPFLKQLRVFQKALELSKGAGKIDAITNAFIDGIADGDALFDYKLIVHDHRNFGGFA